MIIIPTDKVLFLATWDSVSKSREKGFLDFEFIGHGAVHMRVSLLMDCSILTLTNVSVIAIFNL